MSCNLAQHCAVYFIFVPWVGQRTSKCQILRTMLKKSRLKIPGATVTIQFRLAIIEIQ